MTTDSSVTDNRFTAGAASDARILPRIRTGLPLVVACHGAGAAVTGADWLGTGEFHIVQGLAAAGYPVVMPTIPDLWGNATAVARFADAVTYGRANYGASAGPVIALGGSAGMVTALRSHLVTPLACAIGAIPAIDMENMRDTDAMGVRSEIDTAWGVVYPTPLPAGVNPAQNTADYLDLPMQLHYSTTDAVTLPISTTNFASATGAELVDLGTAGHVEASVEAVDVATVLAFIEAHI